MRQTNLKIDLTPLFGVSPGKIKALGDDLMEAFNRSPVADMETWMRTGQPPPVALLRQAGMRYSWSGDVGTWSRFHDARTVYTGLFGFSVPCAEAVAALQRLGPLVEVGSGTGAWAALLAASGVDIVATDVQESGKKGDYRFVVGRHHPVIQMSAAEAAAAFPTRALFCSWPSYGEAWFAEALACIGPRRHVALIGELGGCTGHPKDFEILDAYFDEVEMVSIPQFPGIHDALTIYRRRSLSGPRQGARLP